MAGIYIPGMEMPNTCYDCPFQIDECFGSIKCRYAKTWGSYSSRAVDCPLIPVPDHGRLGDLDELEQAMRNRKHFVGRLSDPDCLVADAPTIIPADGGAE